MVRGVIQKGGFGGYGVPPGRRHYHAGASSSKRGCKDMMLLTEYFRRRAPGPALRTYLTIGFAAMLVAGLPEAGWAWGPENWQIGMQPPATPVKEAIQALHNELLVI